MGRKRTAEREQFLADLLTTAVEHSGYGWFSVSEYKWESVPTSETYAVIHSDDEDETFRIGIDTMAKGLGIIRNAKVGDEGYIVNAKGERLGFGGEARKELLLADRTNSDEGDYDVIGALAVLECALFGKVVYG